MDFLIELINTLPTTGYRTLVLILVLWTMFQPKVGFVWYFAPSAVAERRKASLEAQSEQRAHERRREDKFEGLLKEVMTVIVNNTQAMQHLETSVTQQMSTMNERILDVERTVANEQRKRHARPEGAAH